MSRPRPVEPPPLAPRRSTSAPAGSPGPASATSSRAPPPGRGPSRTANARAVRGVREDVAEQGVDQRLEVRPADRHRQRARGEVGAHVALGVLGQHRPERDPLGDHRGGVALRRRPWRGGAPRRSPSVTARCTASTPAPIRAASSGRGRASASSRSAVSGVRTRCERSATVSRSSRSSSLIRPASVLSAPATTPTSTGAAGSARASSSPRASRCDTAATSIVGADQAAGQPVGHQQAHRQQHHARARRAAARPGRPRRSAPRR